MMKKVINNARSVILTFTLLLFAVTLAYAVPAKPGLKQQLTLADGSTISAMLVGDEFCHYWLGQDGKAYQSIDGVFQAVDVQTSKRQGAVKRNAANRQRAKKLQQLKSVGTVGNYTGNKRGIIILVNFKDVSFKATQADFNNIANTPDYVTGYFKGSMYDYFLAQSQGQFMLNFDVVGPYTLTNNMSYYGSNDSQGLDKHPGEMVIEAVKKANAEVNFADYDWDNDGYVDQVYVVYAGKGEASGGASNTIWPHAYTLSEASYYGDGSGKQKLDGVYIDTYACGNELNTYGRTDGIGTMCHEFSHCLGYPDFYDTDYSGGQGMGSWDLMDSGSYNDDGYRPSGYTAYERWMAGWSEPTELTTTRNVENMKALQDEPESYIIYNKGNRNEFFILENRQFTGWDQDLPGTGLLIIHGDYDENVWSNNQPNDDPNHQRMTWIPADNKYQYELYNGTKYYTDSGMANDPYPYGLVNAFGKNTTPAAKLYNKNSDGTYFLDSSVENITQNSDGTISFLFKAPTSLSAPVFSPKAGVYTSAQTVTISCETEGATIYYTSDGSNPTTNSKVYADPIIVEKTTTLKAIAVLDNEKSEMVTAKYTITDDVISNPDKFVRVASVDDLVAGKRYIIACASKEKAASSLNVSYLNATSVNVDNDTITIAEGVAVFVLEGDMDNGWSFMNEDDHQYLYAKEAKKTGYTDTPQMWTLDNGNNGGVVMTFIYNSLDFGTMLYNSTYSRFNTYTSAPTSSMVQANLYREYSPGEEKQKITLSFSATEAEAEVGEDFTPPTLTIEPEGTAVDVTYSSSDENVATVNETTGEVTLTGVGTTTITATFEGNDTYLPAKATYRLTVRPKITLTNIEVTLTATEGGSIRLGEETASGETKVIQLETDGVLTFEITPDEGHELKRITVNSADMTAEVDDGVLTLNDIRENITVTATFQKQRFTITATADEGGNITLSTEQAAWGDDVTVTIVPDEDYALATLTVDGTDVTSEVTNLTYVIHNVHSDIEVTATFRPTVANITIGPEGMVTYCGDYDLDFSSIDDISAYIACGFVSKVNAVVMVPVTNIPALEGIVVKGKPGTYKVPCAESSDYYVNILKGYVQEASIAPTDGNYTNYFLTDGEDGMAFFCVEEEGTMEANSAIIQLPTAIEVEGGKLTILFIDKQGNKCDVNGDGAVDVADISTVIDEMAARARIQK